MEGGQITQSGSYESLLTAGTAFEQLVNAHRDVVTTLGPSNNQSQLEQEKRDMIGPEECNETNLTRDSSEGEISVKGLPAVQLTEDEEKEIGDVGWKPFLDYIFVSKGTLLLALGIIAQAGFVGFQAGSTYWLALAIQNPNITSVTLVGVYTAISTLSAVFVYLRSTLAARLGLRASRAFFDGFTDAIFKAPMLFFDSTPVGRILTRVSIP
jgi:ABC-type bacteriocin/lantibiotic exporter with double-glycine peptidase domain